MAADFEAREASRRCSCASRSAAEMLRVWSVIDWRFQQREAQGLVLSKGGLRIKRLKNDKKPEAADQRVEILRVSDLGPNAEKLPKGTRPTSGSARLHDLPGEVSLS